MNARRGGPVEPAAPAEAPSDATGAGDGGRDALVQERRHLLHSLADLDAEHAAGDLADGDYAQLRDAYIVRAAEVLRLLGEGGEGADDHGRGIDGGAGPGPGVAAPRARRPARVVVAVAGVVAFALVAGWAVMRASGNRSPGGTASGAVAETTTGLLAEARALLAQDQALEAVKRYDRVLEIDPANAEALAYRGWILFLTGEPDLMASGAASLDDAIAADPDYPDSYFFLGMARREAGDVTGALAAFDRFLALDPPAELAAAVRAAADELRAGPTAATTTTP